MHRLLLLTLLGTTFCATAQPVPACPYHAKDETSALAILTSTTKCSFLSISFNPTEATIENIARALKTTTSLTKSFYLSPDFVVANDQDHRATTLIRAMAEHPALPITQLGLWFESKATTTHSSTDALMASLQTLLATTTVRIKGISIQNQAMDTSHVRVWANMLQQYSKLRTLSLHLRSIETNATDSAAFQDRDAAISLLCETLGEKTTRLKSLTLEPDSVTGSLGVGPLSSQSLGHSLTTNPGTLVNLDLKGVFSWHSDDLTNIFNGIQHSGRGVLSRLVLTNTTLASNTEAIESLHRLLRSDNGFFSNLILDDASKLSYAGKGVVLCCCFVVLGIS
jgi:hypothetical protein